MADGQVKGSAGAGVEGIEAVEAQMVAQGLVPYRGECLLPLRFGGLGTTAVSSHGKEAARGPDG